MARRKTLTDEIRNAIRDCGETRYRIAQASGVTEAALSRFMSGERGLTTESLDKLAAYLNWHLATPDQSNRTSKPKPRKQS